jgi:hypothetical protein
MNQTPESPLASGPAPEQPQTTGITTPRSLFADPPMSLPAQRIAAPSSATAAAKSSSIKRVVLPVAILLIAVAAIAWATQFLPGRVRPPDIKDDSGKAVLAFVNERAVWENDKDYIKEFEFGTNGFYDFVFSNITNSAADIGIFESSCTCSRVEICFLEGQEATACEQAARDGKPVETVAKPSWQPVEVDREWRKSLTVPARACGVLRLHWKGPAVDSEQAFHPMTLTVKLWSREAGQGQDRNVKVLETKILYVRPAMFDPQPLELGSLGPREETSRSFICWSATRQLEVKDASKDERIKVEVTPLNRRRCTAWALRPGMTKVHCAFRVTVTLHEQLGGKQLDLGRIEKPVPITILSGGADVTWKPPLLIANVRGAVRLGNDNGRIDLKPFAVTKGTSKEMNLFAPQDMEVVFHGCEPAYLGITATLKNVETVDGETKWQMVVTVPRKTSKDDAGQLPADAVLVLHVQFKEKEWRHKLVGALGLTATAGEAMYRVRIARVPISGVAESR